ncbi:methyl-accepting chemotaxis protein [Paludibacterium yongneupense]|uniref:methyl-accepting chemotaxis protein n=1 Tax=Paludibacterium yongneupense TaxID=400061 RepID=UPI0003FE1D13|nr:cache domain-containing protein [Paludibacterium yongneupense]
MRFSNIHIAYRLLLVVIIGALGLTLFAAISLSNLHTTLLTEREAKTQEHIDVARTTIQSIAREWGKAGRPQADAQRIALDTLRSVRFSGNQYFWVLDTSGTMLMHPINPALVGSSVLSVTGGDDAHIFADMIDVVRRKGSGFYHYTLKAPGESEAKAKLAFVVGIPEWNWVVGTGVYLDDIDTQFWQLALRLGAIGGAVLILSVAVSMIITRGVVRPLSRVVDETGDLALGRLDKDIPGTERGDEIGDMARALSSVQRNLAGTVAVADRITQGDLTVSVEPISQWDRLGFALQNMTTQLSGLVGDTSVAAGAVYGGANTISTSVESLSVASNQLSASVTEIAATMEELSASASQISEYSGSVADIASLSWESSQKGVQAMALLSSKMESIQAENQSSLDEIIELGRTSKEIGRVMTIINSIADQTKLIAFNAALEAASAGEAGRRFGVVAAEIRRLADNVTESTSEIEARVNQIQDSINRLVITSEKGASSIDEGKSAVAHTAERLDDMVEGARKTNVAAQQISLSTQQQKTAVSQVVISLREIADASKQTAYSMTQLSEVSHDMEGLSAGLKDQVGRFRTESDS